ncbi:MAG: MFS transporter, partial [Gemmatimonadota bacterium]
LTTIVQLGFVAGTATAALLTLADLGSAKWCVGVSCILGAGANALVVATDSYTLALTMRFLTGFFLAGVYPPGMKMIATWFVANRGLAIGALVGALTVGKALPYMLRALEGADAGVVVLSASAGAALAALLVIGFYRDGPHSFERRPFSWHLVGTVMRHRETRLAMAGYLGHMWELYAMWAGISLFTYDYLALQGVAADQAFGTAGLVAFAGIASGGLGAVGAGVSADRIGREEIAIWSMAISGACALVIGWLAHAPAWFVFALVLVWGFAVVADSAQFSALVTELAPRHAVGTALTLQTSLGFLLTAGTIWLMLEVKQRLGWGFGFSLLAIGPVFGIVQMQRLRALRSSRSPASRPARD